MRQVYVNEPIRGDLADMARERAEALREDVKNFLMDPELAKPEMAGWLKSLVRDTEERIRQLEDFADTVEP